MSYAVVRKILRHHGECPPVDYLMGGTDKYLYFTNKVYECAQPDCFDNDFYNLFLFAEGVVFMANSIDFDFYQSFEEAREALNE